MAYRSDFNLAADALDQYLIEVEAGRTPVVKQQPMARLAEELEINELISFGGLTGDRLAAFLGTYLDNAVHIQHPASMGHQVANPHPTKAAH